VPDDREHTDALVARALAASTPTRTIAFVSSYGTPRDDLNLVAHVAALANSGGGVVVVRELNGHALDERVVADVVASYTAEQLDDLEVRRVERSAAIVVGARDETPIVFEKAGTWHDSEGNEHTLFGRGTVFFRHGRRSDPATARDMHRFTERLTRRQHRAWEHNVKKAAHAPADAEVFVVRRKAAATDSLAPVRVVDDPNAPALARTDFDVTHPYRQREVVDLLNDRAGGKIATGYDVQCVRKAYAIDQRPEFFHRPKFGSPQYSDAFVAWMLDEHARDPEFFETAKHIVRPPKPPPEADEAAEPAAPGA